MSWPQVRLESIFEIARGGSPRPIDDYITDANDGLNWISIRDASNSNKYIETTKLKIKPEGLSKTRLVKPGDFLLTNSMSFGRPYIMKTTGCIHDGWLVLSGNPERVDSDYFYHLLGSDLLKRRFSALAAGAVVKNLNIDLVKGVEIPLPPLPEQKRIAAILDKADAIRRKRQQAIQLADDFLRAVFLEMFGDPVTNPKGWETTSLTSCGSFKNGLNFEKGEAGYSLRYLGVGDFKSLSTIVDVLSLGSVELNKLPAKDYLLEDGDLVFVRSNGNKALVGRCITVYPGDEPLTFSGFCIRYRAEGENVEPEYLNYLFRTPSMKQMMLSGGQGANIQNINQGVLSSLEIPLPPAELQRGFSTIVAAYRQSMLRFDSSIANVEDMFEAISQRAFSGQL